MAASTTLSPAERTERARKAATIRWDPEARRRHRERKLAEFIERELAKAPPLSQEQRDRLAALLLPADAG